MSGLALPVPEDFFQALVNHVAKIVFEQVNHEAVALSRYLTTAEAAEYLRCKPQRIHDLLSAGRLSRFKEGGRTLVARDELEALVVCEREARSR